MLGRDVGDKQRRSDGKPPHVAAGQEVICRCPLLAREVKANGKNHNEVQRDDGDIDPGQGLVGEVRRRLDHHSSLDRSLVAGVRTADAKRLRRDPRISILPPSILEAHDCTWEWPPGNAPPNYDVQQAAEKLAIRVGHAFGRAVTAVKSMLTISNNTVITGSLTGSETAPVGATRQKHCSRQ